MADLSLPAYADPPFAAAAPTTTDHKPAPQSVWIQDTDVSGHYRKRYILPADGPPTPPPLPPFDSDPPPPTYSATAPQPLYTIKSHGRGSPLDFRANLPDITIYLGDGDSGPVVATGTLHTTPLKKSLGEVRFFPHPHSGGGGSTTQPSSSSPSSAKDIPAITIKDKDAGKKYTFTYDTHTFTWVQTGPGARPPTPPPGPPSTGGGGLLSKLKLKSAAPPKPPPPHPSTRDTKTWELLAADATKLATYTELQPTVVDARGYRAYPLKYTDGHMARVDVHEPTFDVPGGGVGGGSGGGGGVRELAVVSIMMMVEAQRRKIANSANRSWLDAVGIQGSSTGGATCGGV